MKIVHVEHLIDVGPFSTSAEWKRVEEDIVEAIRLVDWPPGSGVFKLNPQYGKRRGEGNGVTPIKIAWKRYLKSQGWGIETALSIEGPNKPGDMDATYATSSGLFCAEWETGNISSSHRAINKITLGIVERVLVGGALILPSRDMYPYLTDRISNYAEITPYFPFGVL